MSFPYTNSLAEVSAGFPGAVMTPREFRNQAGLPGYVITDELFTIPAAPDPDGKYRVNLDQVPLENLSMAVTVGGVDLVKIPYGQSPGAGQVGVSLLTGALEFHSGLAGQAGTATYTARGSAIMSDWLHWIQLELAATQTELVAQAARRHRASQYIPGAVFPTSEGKMCGCVWLSPNEVKTATVRRVVIVAPYDYRQMPPTGTTTLEIGRDTGFADVITASITHTTTSQATTGTLQIRVQELAERIFIRIATGGGHENLTVWVEWTVDEYV